MSLPATALGALGTILSALIVAAATLTVAAWARLRWGLLSVPRLGPPSDPGVRSSTRPTPKVTAVVPARNEAEALERSIRSLLAQRGVRLRVVIVDDHSTDGTGRIAERLARSDRRIEVLHDPPLPPGWMGKTNAMQRGARGARGDYLLFTDADVVHHPDSLAVAVATARRRRLDLLSLLPRFHAVSTLESLLVPLGLLILQFLTGTDDRRSASTSPVAAGAFMLVRREVFLHTEGFLPIRDAVFDDIACARHLARRGHRVALRLAPRLLEVRLFRGNREAFWGPRKHVVGLLRHRLWLGPVLILSSVVYFGVPPLAMVVGWLTSDAWVGGAGLTLYLMQFAALVPGAGVVRGPVWKRLAHGIAVVPVLACLVAALHDVGLRRSVVWRNRSVALPEGEDDPFDASTRTPTSGPDARSGGPTRG